MCVSFSGKSFLKFLLKYLNTVLAIGGVGEALKSECTPLLLNTRCVPEEVRHALNRLPGNGKWQLQNYRSYICRIMSMLLAPSIFMCSDLVNLYSGIGTSFIWTQRSHTPPPVTTKINMWAGTAWAVQRMELLPLHPSVLFRLKSSVVSPLLKCLFSLKAL